MTNLFNLLTVNCDAPRPWGVYFQDSASPQMEALVELHDNIMFYLVIILFGVAWILVSIIRNYVYSKSPISNKYLNHGTLIELIWTITPALILILIAFPSFKLLYLMDEVTDPSLTVFVEGHQWYWSYQYPDFLGNYDEELEFDSYLIPDSDLSHIVSLSTNNQDMPEYIGQEVNNPIFNNNRRSINLVFTEYKNLTGESSAYYIFIFDDNQHSGRNFQNLFSYSKYRFSQQNGCLGIKLKIAESTFDGNSDRATPRVNKNSVSEITQGGLSIMSRGQEAVEVIPTNTKYDKLWINRL